MIFWRVEVQSNGKTVQAEDLYPIRTHAELLAIKLRKAWGPTTVTKVILL